MRKFESVSILLPTLNETFSFIETVDIILDECDKKDICEFIAIVCDRTESGSLKAIGEAASHAEKEGIPIVLLYQKKPFAGGAVQDGMMEAKGSHTLMMAPDLETDPHTVKEFIRYGKKYPNDMITASRWLKKGSFEGYSKVKYVLNFIFQKMFSFYYGVKLTDMTFGFRLAPTDVFQSINWEELRHPFFLETLLKPIKIGIKVHEIPSSWTARQEGTSQNSLLQTFKYLKIAFKVKFERKTDIIRQN